MIRIVEWALRLKCVILEWIRRDALGWYVIVTSIDEDRLLKRIF